MKDYFVSHRPYLKILFPAASGLVFSCIVKNYRVELKLRQVRVCVIEAAASLITSIKLMFSGTSQARGRVCVKNAALSSL